MVRQGKELNEGRNGKAGRETSGQNIVVLEVGHGNQLLHVAELEIAGKDVPWPKMPDNGP